MPCSFFLFSRLRKAQSLQPHAAEPAAPPTIQEKTAGMKHFDGLIPLDWDARTGKLYFEIQHLGADGKSPDLLYVTFPAIRNRLE